MDIHEAIVRVDLLLDIDSTYGSDWDAWQMVRSRAVAPLKACEWKEDADGNWDTGCGSSFAIIDGTPEENKMAFCPYCGGQLVQKLLVQDEDED